MMLIGDSQTFIYDEGGDQITLTLDAIASHYISQGEDSFLDLAGYDRIIDPEYSARILNSSQGYSFWVGRNLEPHRFQWVLNLPHAMVATLQGMVLRQQREKQPIVLLDQRLPIQEPTPRTRALVSSLPQPYSVPGTVWYWPVFHVRLDLAIGPYFDCDTQLVTLSGEEILPYPTPAEDR